jgi:hypothetical protein
MKPEFKCKCILMENCFFFFLFLGLLNSVLQVDRFYGIISEDGYEQHAGNDVEWLWFFLWY